MRLLITLHHTTLHPNMHHLKHLLLLLPEPQLLRSMYLLSTHLLNMRRPSVPIPIVRLHSKLLPRMELIHCPEKRRKPPSIHFPIILVWLVLSMDQITPVQSMLRQIMVKLLVLFIR